MINQNSTEHTNNTQEFFLENIEDYSTIQEYIESLETVDEQFDAMNQIFLEITASGWLSEEQYLGLQELNTVLETIEIEFTRENEEQIMKKNMLSFCLKKYIYESDTNKIYTFTEWKTTIELPLKDIYSNISLFMDMRIKNIEEKISTTIKEQQYTSNIDAIIYPNPIQTGEPWRLNVTSTLEEQNSFLPEGDIVDDDIMDDDENGVLVSSSNGIFDNDRIGIQSTIEAYNNISILLVPDNPFYGFIFPGEIMEMFQNNTNLIDKRNEHFKQTWKEILLYNSQWKLVHQQACELTELEYADPTQIRSDFSWEIIVNIPDGLEPWVYIYKIPGTNISKKVIVNKRS